MSGDGRPHLILVGTGGRPYREYSLEALAGSWRLSAILPAEPAWQRPYLDDWLIADTSDEHSVTAAAALLRRGDAAGEGVLTWDETALENTAAAAEKLSLPHMSAAAASRCRDKHLTRSLLAPTAAAVRSRLAGSASEAALAAASIGYPVIVKPRALAGSAGVVKADSAAALPDAFRIASGAGYATLPTGHGVLVEEYLDGPEISVDSVVSGGRVRCAHVARKRLGFAPHFEEVGHLVTGWTGEPWAKPVHDLLCAAHEALGVELAVTHAEVRLTGDGPRLVELNGRLGGDLIPLLGRLATGIDTVTAAAELAVGREPAVRPGRELCAEVRFIYPRGDGIVRRVSLDRAAAVPGITHAVALAEPGTTLLMPPRQAIPRLAALIAVAPGERACAAALDQAEAETDVEMEVLAGG